MQFAGTPLRVEQAQAVKEADFVSGTDAAVEILEVGAAAESHVLAIVHVLAVRKDVGRGAAAEEGPLLKQPDAEPGFSQRDAGGQSRQPAADHDHAFRGHSLPLTA